MAKTVKSERQRLIAQGKLPVFLVPAYRKKIAPALRGFRIPLKMRIHFIKKNVKAAPPLVMKNTKPAPTIADDIFK
jgi:hypothetical protein